MNILKNNSIRNAKQTPFPKLGFILSLARSIFGGDRFENLYKAIDKQIHELGYEKIRLLDYGCGTMNFSRRLKEKKRISDFIGMDIYPKPIGFASKKGVWKNYRQIPKDGISKLKGKFDLSIVIDVLHHAPEHDHANILKALSKVSKLILVKDHFEYGFFSRHLLRLADWYGNYAYGVSIPKRYYDKRRWRLLIENSELTEIKLKRNIKVHQGLFGLIVQPRNHFISILRPKNSREYYEA